ncbi:MAG: hypothetical protein WC717_06365, partial [Candidatus Micrarchaeia archaeon]
PQAPQTLGEPGGANTSVGQVPPIPEKAVLAHSETVAMEPAKPEPNAGQQGQYERIIALLEEIKALLLRLMGKI